MPEYSEEDFEAAARYVRHDFGRKTIASVLEEYGMKKPEEPKEGDPTAPPEKTEEEKKAEKPKKKGVWWPREEEAEEKPND